MNRREKGSLSISPHITELIAALEGGYQYRRLKATGINTLFSSQPLKNKYSHWADAFQYGSLHIVSNIISDADMEMMKRLANASVRRSRR